MKKIEEILFKSEIRMRLLIFLNEKTQDIKSLCMRLGVDEQSLIPHINMLEEHHFITSHSKAYGLTTLGSIMADKLIPLMEIIDEVDDI